MIASMYTLSRADWRAIGLKDVYGLHKAIYTLFPKVEGQTRDFLFADKGGDWQERKILILSERKPMTPQFGSIVSKEIPESFLEHNLYGFEVILNPTKREKTTGKTVAIRGRENLLAWFNSKALSLGFSIVNNCLQVQNEGVQTFNKDGTLCTHNIATFIGKLAVADRVAFVKSFKEGIGRAKAFGFGLLQIIPLIA